MSKPPLEKLVGRLVQKDNHQPLTGSSSRRAMGHATPAGLWAVLRPIEKVALSSISRVIVQGA